MSSCVCLPFIKPVKNVFMQEESVQICLKLWMWIVYNLGWFCGSFVSLVWFLWSAGQSVLGHPKPLLMCWSAPCMTSTGINVWMHVWTTVSRFGQKHLLNVIRVQYSNWTKRFTKFLIILYCPSFGLTDITASCRYGGALALRSASFFFMMLQLSY